MPLELLTTISPSPQSVPLGSMAMAAPSRVPSACTAAGPATMSAASASASPDSPEPFAIKVLSPGTGRGVRGGRVQGDAESWEGSRREELFGILIRLCGGSSSALQGLLFSR